MPGGVALYTPRAKRLGVLVTSVRTGNVLVAPEGVFIAADSRLLFLRWAEGQAAGGKAE